jgi:hypothetical protein
MDIQSIIDKIDKLPIPDKDKASLLNQIKQNMMNPAKGEDESLQRIQSKYITPGLLSSPQDIQQPYNTHSNTQSNIQYNHHSYNPSQQLSMSPQQLSVPQVSSQLPANIMTTAHFEILKNKIDSVQLELVDLLRHVKDYTQRYMNATRQQDMEKIDAYINGLFEVDKKMKDAEAKAKEYEETEPEEAEPENRDSLIGKATSGIKNFLGGIGDNVSGVASLVTNTANIANSYLSKKIIGSDTTSNTTPTIATSPNTINNINTKSQNKNVVSVDDYIKSNMNSLETNTDADNAQSNNNTQVANSDMNNINKLETTNPSSKTVSMQEKDTSSSEDEVAAAIKKLNDTMNEDIDNTVKEGEKEINTTNTPSTTISTATPTATPTTIQSGGRSTKKEVKLSRKIKLLRLKLTKHKLEKELKYTKRMNNNNKKNMISKNKTKHKMQ